MWFRLEEKNWHGLVGLCFGAIFLNDVLPNNFQNLSTIARHVEISEANNRSVHLNRSVIRFAYHCCCRCHQGRR